MLKPSNKIIIVDNRRDHLDTLSKPFHDQGIGCRSLQYDVTYTPPLTGVRLAFFDINLNDLADPQQNAPQIYATLVDAIRLYISADNGPFVLIFWTSNGGLIGGFKTYIQERHEVVPQPFLVANIDKHEFLETGNSLQAKLDEILQDSLIQLFFSFEEIAIQSAGKTVDELWKIIPANDAWGESAVFKANFDLVFSRIAETSFGLTHAKRHPARAVYSALSSVLSHHVNGGLGLPDKWLPALTALRTAKKSSDLAYPGNFNFRMLNNFFHIELSEGIKPTDRGAVLSCPPDFMIDPEYNCAHASYFQDLQVKMNDLFEQFVIFRENISDAEKSFVRGTSRFILVEISAGCDYAQEKRRIPKYVWGMMTPPIAEEKCRNSSGAVFTLPEIFYDSKSWQIRLNFNHMFGPIERDDFNHKALFMIKGSLVDQIGNRYASHVSRIGITSF